MSDLRIRNRDLLYTYLKPQWRRLALFAVLLACGIGLTLVNPQIVRIFIDSALAGGNASAPASALPGTLASAAVLFLLAAAARQGVMLATDYIGELIAWKSTNALRADLALHCLRLDLPFHKAHAPGELIERIDGDVSSLANYLSRFSLRVLGNGLLVLGTLVVLLAEDWRVGVGITLYVCIAFTLLWRLQNLGVGQWAAERQTEAEYASFLEERLQGTEDIRSSGAERYILERLRRLTQVMLGKYRTARLTSNITFVVVQGLYALAYALGLGAGAWLYLQGQATIGTAYLIVYYIALLATPIDEIRFQVQNLQTASASVGRVADLFAYQPTVHDEPKVKLPAGPLAVTFDSVTFKYDEAPMATNLALDGVTLHVEPGEVLGVLGRTGSGKSTLTRLLFRLYDPLTGSIRLAGSSEAGADLTGLDLRDVSLSDLRARIALVTQDVQLFEGTIRDNLTLFNRHIGDAQIEAALRTLGLWEWVQSRQGGLDGKLAPGGQGLSAGEAQLLAFTRAFLKDPGLVVLDEASSRLDPGTERLLEQAVSELLRGRTGIIIAHRLGTVQRADHIAIFEEGRMVEYGRRTDLSRDPDSRFYKLLQSGLEQALVAEKAEDAPSADIPDTDTPVSEQKEVADEHVAL